MPEVLRREAGAAVGRAGLYFRMLLIGYFEKPDSERQLDSRCDDPRSLRTFLGIAENQPTPDHSNLSRTRQRIDVELHQAVFDWVLRRLAEHGAARENPADFAGRGRPEGRVCV